MKKIIKKILINIGNQAMELIGNILYKGPR